MKSIGGSFSFESKFQLNWPILAWLKGAGSKSKGKGGGSKSSENSEDEDLEMDQTFPQCFLNCINVPRTVYRTEGYLAHKKRFR